MAKVKIGTDYSRLLRKMKDRAKAAELANATRVEVRIKATGDRSEVKNIIILRTQMKRDRLDMAIAAGIKKEMDAAIKPHLEETANTGNRAGIRRAADIVRGILVDDYSGDVRRDLKQHTGDTARAIYAVVVNA